MAAYSPPFTRDPRHVESSGGHHRVGGAVAVCSEFSGPYVASCVVILWTPLTSTVGNIIAICRYRSP